MGKSSPKAPTPDPLIGQAAQGNIELGRESLAFARQQYEEGKIRQVDLDALTKQVADSALASQTKAEQWAQLDRDKQSAAYDKYEGYAAARHQRGAWRSNRPNIDRASAAKAATISPRASGVCRATCRLRPSHAAATPRLA